MFKNLIKDYLKNKRLARNIFSQINLNISSTLIQFIFPPLMILIYGLENFGVWIFIIDFLNRLQCAVGWQFGWQCSDWCGKW